jgi:hypothetical protein
MPCSIVLNKTGLTLIPANLSILIKIKLISAVFPIFSTYAFLIPLST